jgi:hypothetical protein
VPDALARNAGLREIEMTLIVVTKRPEFAVLAADRFHGAAQPPAPKVVYHPNLAIPLAFAIGGCTHLLLKGKQAPATEHLLEFAQEIASPEELELASIDRCLKELVSPGIAEKQCEARVYIALVRNGEAAVGFRNFSFRAGRVETEFYEECRPFYPEQIENAFQQLDWESFHDQTVTDAALVTSQARLLVDKGIAYDKKLHGGVPGSCDGPAEVVLVSSAGAKLV